MPPPASPEVALTLALVGTAARRRDGEAQIRELAERVDHTALERVLRRHVLLALAGTRLEAVAPERLSDELRGAIRQEVDATRRRGSVQAALTPRWVATLEAAGIRCLPVKGSGLAQRIHGDLGLRPSADVDLLVAAEQLREAVAILREDGFVAPRDPVSKDGLPAMHFQLHHPRGALPEIELHWRLCWYEEGFSATLLRHSAMGPDGIRVAHPPEELAALLLFYARDGFAGLRLAADIAAWWDVMGDTLAPRALEAVAEAHPELRFVLATAAVIAERLVGLPAGRLLDPAPAFTARGRAAARLANWDLSGTPGQHLTNVYLVDLMLSPSGGEWAALRRQLFRMARPRTGAARVVEEIRRHLLRPPTRAARSAAGLWRIRGERTVAPPVPPAA
jgi:hypothetical protein